MSSIGIVSYHILEAYFKLGSVIIWAYILGVRGVRSRTARVGTRLRAVGSLLLGVMLEFPRPDDFKGFMAAQA